MAKAKFTDEDDALLAELGVEVDERKASSRSAREERIIAGFEDIERFFEQHGRVPTNGEDKDIFERLYAVRLDQLRTSSECRAVLASMDKHDLLAGQSHAHERISDDLDDDALLAELGVLDASENNITKLTHVKTRAEVRAAEEVAKRVPCLDFDKFKPLFITVQQDLESGIRKSRPFELKAEIRPGAFFIVGGQKAYVAEMEDIFINDQNRTDARLRVIYDNGTESNVLMRSLQRALHKDEAGRRITDSTAGPLFSDDAEDEDLESGTIYVLRSKSEHPYVSQHREIIHKIGVTGGSVATRIANAKDDATYLLADVEVVASYKLYNIGRSKLEKIFHRVFANAQIDLLINDRFGKPVKPREWFLVPLSVIDEVVEKIKDGSIKNYIYDPRIAALKNFN